MNGTLLLVAFISVVNPLRTRGALPESPGGRARALPLAIGGILTVASVAALAGWSKPMLDGLQITPEMFKIAAGFVAVIAGGHAFTVAVPAREPELAGWRAGVWPVWYPRLLTPEVMFLAVTAGAANGVMAVTGAAAVGIAGIGAFIPVRGEVGRRLLVWLGRVLSALLILVGIWLAIDGVRDV